MTDEQAANNEAKLLIDEWQAHDGKYGLYLDGDEWNILEQLLTAALAARERAVTWTSEKPTVPGWYFWKQQPRGHETVVRVFDTYVYWGGGLRTEDISNVSGQWAGPIPAPEEAAP